MDSFIASRRGVQTIVTRYSLSTILTWLTASAIKSADWNRPEVAKRKGNDSDLMASIIQGFSIGLFIAFYNGKVIDGKISPTKEYPVYVTEGGHRLRWLMKILNGETVVHGMSISDIKTKNPELYDYIMNYKIIIETKTHVSGEMSEKYMRAEYNAVNTHSELLKPGEMRSTDDNVDALCRVIDDEFNHRKAKTNAKAREAGIHLKHRLIGSMASNNFRNMSTTDYNLPSIPHESTRTTIEEYIKKLGTIESEYFDSAPKKVKTKMATAIDDKIHGTLFYGIVNNPDTAEDIIRKFYEIATVDENAYAQNMDKIKKKSSGSNGGDRFTNPEYFSSRWRIIKTIANPVIHDDTNSNESETI